MKKIVLFALSFVAVSSAVADDFSLVNKGSKEVPVAWTDVSNWTNHTLGAMAERLPEGGDSLKGSAYVTLDEKHSHSHNNL